MRKMRPAGRAALTAGFSLLFAAACVLGKNIVYSGGIFGYPTENYMTRPGAKDALLFAVLAAACVAAVSGLAALLERFRPRLGRRQRRGLFGFVVPAALLLAWLPWLLSFYPGILYGDALSSLQDFLRAGYPVSNHHPILYTYLTAFFYRLGLRLGSAAAGLFLMTLLQSLLMAVTAARVLGTLWREGVPSAVIAAGFLFYAAVPIFPGYAVAFWKDPLFTCALTALTLELLHCAKSGSMTGRSLGRLLLFSLLACFLRNNGVYVVAGTALCIPLCVRQRRGRVLLCFAALILAYSFVTGAGYRRFGIRQEFVESVGVPLQQLGAVVWYEGSLSEEDRAFLFELMPEEQWRENYTPCIADSLKWCYYFNEDFLEANKGAFLKTWLHAVCGSPATALRAYLVGTHGFWKPLVQDPYGDYGTFAAEGRALGIRERDLLQELCGVSGRELLTRRHVSIGSGTLFWLTAAAFLLCLLRGSRAWLAFAPALLNWLFVMASTPCAYSLRYVYILAFGLPLFLCLPLMRAGGGAAGDR